jgi:hypothetical protein
MGEMVEVMQSKVVRRLTVSSSDWLDVDVMESLALEDKGEHPGVVRFGIPALTLIKRLIGNKATNAPVCLGITVGMYAYLGGTPTAIDARVPCQ